MTKGKRLNVSNDTHLHMTTTYKRKARGGKQTQKRSFNFVVKGLLISTSLVGSVLLGGMSAFADSPSEPVNSQPSTVKASTQSLYQDEMAMMSNLKMANKVLEAAIQEGQLTASMYEKATKVMISIEAKADMGEVFNKQAELEPILADSDRILKQAITVEDQKIIDQRDSSLKALERVQLKLGVDSSITAEGAHLKGSNDFTGRVEVETQIASSSVSASSSNIPITQYRDYNSNAYWSQDMVWAVDQGLIKGYVNQIHPRGVHAGVGNWVDPHGSLTEAQLLSILFRYTHQAELENTAPKDPFWASTAYQLAHKYNVPTKGSLSNKAEANKGTTRGQLATTLATIHFGKQVSLREAVDFMYETGITYGRTDARGNSPMTFESFGANDPLQRAHITSFMKRYHDYLQKGGSVNPAPPTSQPAPPTTQPTPPPTSSFDFSIKASQNNKVGNITVHYGQHTYGSRNQAEYNEVMKRVHDTIKKDLASTPFMEGHDGALYQYFDNFMAGEKPIMDRNHPEVRSSKNVALRAFDTRYTDLRDAGVKKNTIEEVAKAGVLAVSLMSHAKDPRDGSPNSAHDAIVKGLIDCDAEAQVYSAVYDSLGYTTAILAKPGHAFVVIKIEGNWYLDTAGVYTKLNMQQVMSQGLQVVVPPTDGSTLR